MSDGRALSAGGPLDGRSDGFSDGFALSTGGCGRSEGFALSMGGCGLSDGFALSTGGCGLSDGFSEGFALSTGGPLDGRSDGFSDGFALSAGGRSDGVLVSIGTLSELGNALGQIRSVDAQFVRVGSQQAYLGVVEGVGHIGTFAISEHV